MNEIAELEQQLKDMARDYYASIEVLHKRLKALKTAKAQADAPDIVRGQKRRVTAGAYNKWGVGNVGDIVTVEYVCFAYDRNDKEYLAAVVMRGGYGVSTFPVDALRDMPIVEDAAKEGKE